MHFFLFLIHCIVYFQNYINTRHFSFIVSPVRAKFENTFEEANYPKGSKRTSTSLATDKKKDPT